MWHLNRQGKPFAPAHFRTPHHLPPLPTPSHASTAKSKQNERVRHALANTAKAQAPSPIASPNGGARSLHEAPLDAIDGAAALLAYVARHLPGPASDEFAAHELSQTLARLGAPAGSPPTARGVLLAHSLHAAGICNAHDAKDVLETMAKFDFADMDNATSSSPAEARAWLIARALARTDTGFEALEHLRLTEGHQPPAADAAMRRAQRVMLQAADALEPEPDLDPAALGLAKHDPAPGATARRHEPLPGAEPKTAPFAWRAYDSALTLLTAGKTGLTAEKKGVFFAWRQNFREDGRGSDLSQARERLYRFSAKTIDRGGENRWKTYLPRLVGRHAAPQRALNYGTQSATRGTASSERAAFQRALKNALDPLTERPEMRPAHALSHGRPERSIAELAALHVWLKSGGFVNDHPSPAQLKEIAEHAKTLCDNLQMRKVSSPAVLKRMRETTAAWAKAKPRELMRDPAFKKIVKRRFTVKRLASWGKAARVPDDSPFWENVKTLMDAADPATSASATTDIANADEVRDTLKEVVSNLESSASLRLTDGGRIGFTTRGLSANISKLLHAGAVPISPRVDMRASRARESVIALSRNTQGLDVFLGTHRTRVRHAGVGLMVGYDMEVGMAQARAGVTTQATLHSDELEEPRGVSLRVKRQVHANGNGYDDDAMREKQAGVIDHIFDEATNARGNQGGGAQGTWDRLAEYCFDHDFDEEAISVSFTDGISRTRKRGGSVDASMWFTLPFIPSRFRTGFNVGTGYEKTTKQTQDLSDRSGRMQVEQHRFGDGMRRIFRMGGSFSGNATEGKVSVGFVSFDAPATTTALDDDTRAAKVRLVRDGTLVERASVLDFEYSSVGAYASDLQDDREQWITLFARQAEDENKAALVQAALHGRPPPVLTDPREAAAARLDAHIGEVRVNARFNQTYVQRHQLKAKAARRLDMLEALRTQLPRKATQARAEIDESIQRILNDPDVWAPVELKVKERNSVTRGVGINVFAQLNSQTSATNDREIFAEKIPFALRDALCNA